MDKGELLKVTLEYENEIYSLEGTDATEWEEDIKNMTIMLEFRRQNPFNDKTPNWIKKPKAKDQKNED